MTREVEVRASSAPVSSAASTREPSANDRIDDLLSSATLPLLGALTLVGLLVRLPSFNDSLFGDELSTHFIVVGNSLGRVLTLVHSRQEVTPPLFFVLAWATKGLLADPKESIRLVSLVTGLAAIPLTFVLGLRVVGRRAAFVGATCVALAPIMILYSTEARGYMLVMFFALLSSLALLQALDTGRTTWWVVYAGCTCAVLYTHYAGVFFLAVLLAWAFWTHAKARAALMIANVAAVVAFLPWLGGFREDLGAPTFLPELSFRWFNQVVEQTAFGHPYVPFAFMPGRPAAAVGMIGLAVGAIGFVLRARRTHGWSWHLSSHLALLLALTIVPLVLITFESAVHNSILAPRYLLASWPPFVLVIGALVTSSRRFVVQVIAVTLTVATFAAGAVKMVRAGMQRPNAEEAMNLIVRVGRTGDPIVISPFGAHPLSDFEVELEDAGLLDRYPVLRLGLPQRDVKLRPLSGPNPQVKRHLPVIPAQDIATKAVRKAKDGTIFLVAGTPIAPVLKDFPDHPISIFVHALPSRFRIVRRLTYPGYAFGLQTTVYEFQDTSSRS